MRIFPIQLALSICGSFVLSFFAWRYVHLDHPSTSLPYESTPEDSTSLTSVDSSSDPQSLPLIIDTLEIEKNSSVFQTLNSAGLGHESVFRLIQAAKEHHDLSRVPANTIIKLFYKESERDHPFQIRFLLTPREALVLDRSQDLDWTGKLEKAEISTESRSFQGQVRSSLWESASSSGMSSEVVGALTEVFAWQIDFSREVRSGDRWRLTVDEIFADGKSIGWGAISAAEYVLRGQSQVAVRFDPSSESSFSYFEPNGESMRKLFLRSPIRFARISSRFQRQRFHPILQRNIPHRGVDYAAPTGTPIRAVGGGSVTYAGRKGASGVHIQIRHNSVYETGYSHLSRIAKGVRVGFRVDQGETIGYVGSTGLATGPHLHFSFYENGRFVDPLGVKFPSAAPVPAPDRERFDAVAAQAMETLPEWQLSEEDLDEERVARRL